MLLTQANRAMGRTERPGSGFLAWAMSQAVPFLMKRRPAACWSGSGRPTPSSSS